ncbi:Chitinase A1 [Andreprevotia sp. IGB-42]|uniref:glycosyl hydrolase family 18 protein n=1 Tax=Andreprevotia sp. IGB-42 TaxID=2497473 RepID=UPI001356BD53|nr:glycosyl hydrolase family 18 protein [Andreprevotia sp. IGB-42]KAF0811591.1 Chitinase A1 [Andreprevotia sp. IGB-42]
MNAGRTRWALLAILAAGLMLAAGAQAATWQAGASYPAAAKVEFDGKQYAALQATQANSGVNPASAPGLWQLVEAAQLPATSTAAPLEYKKVAYYVSWAMYRDYSPLSIPAEKLTHINYAFANIVDGKVVLGDRWSDEKNFPDLLRLKRKHPHLKTLISIGGAAWSKDFSTIALTEANRSVFADSVVAFIRKYGFDGADIDWEFPTHYGWPGNTMRAEDPANFPLLFKTVRARLDEAGKADGKPYLLTLATEVNPHNLPKINWQAVLQSADWLNVMTYEYAGAWNLDSGHIAPLYADAANPGPNAGIFNIANSIKTYLSLGVAPEKLVMGFELPGHIWTGCPASNNGMYVHCTGMGAGTWKGDTEGNLDYQDLKANYINKNGYTRYWSDSAKVPYLYNAAKQASISYEDPQSIATKVAFLKENRLGGAMIWEITADRDQDLLKIIHDGLSISPMDYVRTAGKVALEKTSAQHGWPGVYFDGRFSGSSIGVKFNDTLNHYDVLVDGKLAADVIKPGNTTVWVKNLQPGEHTVRVARRTEAPDYVARFLGFVAAEDGKLLAPPAAAARQMEFIGDSYTVGYGSRSAGRECTPQQIFATTDATRSFGAITAQHYGADFQINGYSGLGMIRNFDGALAPTHYRSYYDLALPGTPGSTWVRPASWKPQVVVIGLGINDFSRPVKTGEAWTAATRKQQYKAAYHAFLAKLRQQYGPQTLLIPSATPIWQADDFIPAVKEVVAEAQAAGDKQVRYFEYGGLDALGCEWHPSAKDHELIAAQLQKLLEEEKLAW